MRAKRRILAAVGMSLAVALLLITASSAVAFGPSDNPCALISKAALMSDLGLTQLYETPTIGNSYPTAQDGQVASNCKILAWSGSKPTTLQQSQQKLANGTGAALYIRTWIADPGAPADKLAIWEQTDFDKTLTRLDMSGITVILTGLHGKVSKAPALGALGTEFRGVRGPAGGVGAFWYSAQTHAIIFLGLGESKNSPYIKQFNKFAGAVVPAFGL